MSYGPKYSIGSDEICGWPRALDLPVLASGYSDKEFPALIRRDFVPHHVVYLVCVGAEDGEGINFLKPNTPAMNAMPICMS
ncbi:MAG TPA: hypothetical protein VFH67_03580, partial [bacterium]|nr:hypothetical protein [bacterium]